MSAKSNPNRPPASAEHVVGTLLEFSATDDLANPDGATLQLKPVELTPVGTSAARIEFRPADEQLRPEGDAPGADPI